MPCTYDVLSIPFTISLILIKPVKVDTNCPVWEMRVLRPRVVLTRSRKEKVVAENMNSISPGPTG